MGLFSRKVKKYTSVSNSRFVEENKRPQAIKDSTAAYINDLPKMTNPSATSIVDYNLRGIEESGITSYKRAIRFTDKADKFHQGLQVTGLVADDINLIYQRIADVYHTENPSINILYIEGEHLDYAHLTKMILKKKYSWNALPTINTLEYDEQEYWLVDSILYLKEQQEISPLGYSFKAGEAGDRNSSIDRAYTSWIFTNELNYTEKMVSTLLEKFKESTKVITTTEKDNEGNIVNTETEETILTSTNINNKPQTFIKETISNTSVDTMTKEVTKEDGTIVNHTIEITTTYKDKVYSGDTKEVTDYFDDFFTNIPSDLNPAGSDIPDTPESDAALDDYKNQIENGLVKEDYFAGIFSFLISYKYTDEYNEEHLVFDIINESSSATLVNCILDNLYATSLNNYPPNLYFSIEGKSIEDMKTSKEQLFKESKLYAKKLGIKYAGFYSKMTEDMGDDLKKVRASYLTFGCNIRGISYEEKAYCFEYFKSMLGIEKDITGNSLVKGSNQSIIKEDNYGKEIFSWSYISREVVTGSMNEEEISFSEVNNSFIFKRAINDNQIEVITVKDYQRQMYVHKGMYGQASDDSKLLVPIDNYILYKFKIFKEREAILYKSMYVEFLAYVEVKQKWYETKFFKIAMVFVGAAITVMTGGAASFIQGLLISTVTNIAIDFAIKGIIKAFGAKNAQWLAIVVAVGALISGTVSGLQNISSGLQKAMTVFYMKANTLVNLAMQTFNSANQVIGIERQKEMEELNRQLQDLKEESERLLGVRVNNSLSYLDGESRNYISSYINIGDDIEDIMNRITNYNKMQDSIDYVHEYASYMISLPTIKETLQEITQQE